MKSIHNILHSELSPNGQYIAIGSNGNCVEIIDTKTEKRIFSDRRKDWIINVSWSPDSKMVAASGFSVNLFIINVEDNSNYMELDSEDISYNICWNPKRDEIAVVTSTKIDFCNVDGKLNNTIEIELEAENTTTDWSQDGKKIAVGYDFGKVLIYDVEKDAATYNILNTRTINEIKWSPDGEFFAIASSRHCTIFDKKGREVEKIPTDRMCLSVNWSPNGKWLACANSGDILVFDTRKYNLINKISTSEKGYHIQWSPDSRYIINSHGREIRKFPFALFETPKTTLQSVAQSVLNGETPTGIMADLMEDEGCDPHLIDRVRLGDLFVVGRFAWE